MPIFCVYGSGCVAVGTISAITIVVSFMKGCRSMELDRFVQQVKRFPWFEHHINPQDSYHVLSSVFEAYDSWNEQMLKIWEPQICALEALAVAKIGDSQIDSIFSDISCEIEDLIWQKWCDFVARNHLERETGLEAELLDMIKRDLSWAYVEQIVKAPGFFSDLLQIYQNGYFPCAWIGEYPKGKPVVL